MFKIPGPNRIESDEGFSIEVLGRTGMKYREGDKFLFIDSEVLSPGTAIVISSKSIEQWDPPYSAHPISPDERAAIIERIRRALEFRRHSLVVV